MATSINGHVILHTLKQLRDHATFSAIVEHIAEKLGVARESIQKAVQESLRAGIRAGYVETHQEDLYSIADANMLKLEPSNAELVQQMQGTECCRQEQPAKPKRGKRPTQKTSKTSKRARKQMRRKKSQTNAKGILKRRVTIKLEKEGEERGEGNSEDDCDEDSGGEEAAEEGAAEEEQDGEGEGEEETAKDDETDDDDDAKAEDNDKDDQDDNRVKWQIQHVKEIPRPSVHQRYKISISEIQKQNDNGDNRSLSKRNRSSNHRRNHRSTPTRMLKKEEDSDDGNGASFCRHHVPSKHKQQRKSILKMDRSDLNSVNSRSQKFTSKVFKKEHEQEEFDNDNKNGGFVSRRRSSNHRRYQRSTSKVLTSKDSDNVGGRPPRFKSVQRRSPRRSCIFAVKKEIVDDGDPKAVEIDEDDNADNENDDENEQNETEDEEDIAKATMRSSRSCNQARSKCSNICALIRSKSARDQRQRCKPHPQQRRRSRQRLRQRKRKRSNSNRSRSKLRKRSRCRV